MWRRIFAYHMLRNPASGRVMQKLGMTRDAADDFEDPTVPVGHYQRPHVVYRVRNPEG